MYKKNPTVSKDEIIADRIRKYIAEKDIPAGVQLPSVREFAKMFDTSKETVSAAVELLSIAGLVLAKPRYGIFSLNDAAANPDAVIDWDKIKNRSTHFHLNHVVRNFLDYLEGGGDTLFISQAYAEDKTLVSLFEDPSLANMPTLTSQRDMIDSYYGQGLKSLREALSKHMASYGLYADPEQIVVTRSYRETIIILGSLLISKGSAVFFEDPGNLNSQTYLHTLGAAMRGIGADRHGISASELVKALKDEKCGVFFTFPVYSLPTGMTTSKTRKRDILRLLSGKNIPIVEVDLYRDLDFEAPAPYCSLDKTAGTIYVGSFDLVLPWGFSLSWVVVPRNMLVALKEIQFQHDCTASPLLQTQIRDILENGIYLKYLGNLKKYIDERAKHSDALMEKHLGGLIKWTGAHPLVYWAELPFPCRNLRNKNSDVRVATGDMYSQNHPNHIVISKVNPDVDEYEKGLIKLRDLIAKFV
jgi:GntR family transcriptional regulator of abcA and norABC